jgi:hypothetical protein
MGVSPQNIFTYFKRDDMKLSYAQEIASRLGYDLSFRFEKADGVSGQKAYIEIENLVNESGLMRLAFLRLAMGQYGIQRKTLAEQLGIGYTGLNRWFKVDDIAISYLFKIADLYGLTVRVKATQKKAQTPQDLDLG